jgi:hypothetical protein
MGGQMDDLTVSACVQNQLMPNILTGRLFVRTCAPTGDRFCITVKRGYLQKAALLYSTLNKEILHPVKHILTLTVGLVCAELELLTVFIQLSFCLHDPDQY